MVKLLSLFSGIGAFEKKKDIQRLEHSIQMLQFENEELEQKLIIANEINQYRKAQAQVSE